MDFDFGTLLPLVIFGGAFYYLFVYKRKDKDDK